MTTLTGHTLAERVRHFVDTRIIPREAELAAEQDGASQLSDQLSQEARQAGLSGLFFPDALGGEIATLGDYLPVAFEEGRSEFAPAILRADLAVDAHMLHRFGSPLIQVRFAKPLAAGLAVAGYAMSEPDRSGSVPATLGFDARKAADGWCLNGRKWFICRSGRAQFFTVVARTAEDSLSMLLVPADTPGFTYEGGLNILGHWQGQGALSFDQVRIPFSYLLGREGQGRQVMQSRLLLGRMLRSAHWIGLARRCSELMHTRIHSPRGSLIPLADKQLVRARVYDVYRAIASAEGLLQTAAAGYDRGEPDSIAVNVAKLAASDALSRAVDSAIQVHGAEGLGDGLPLARIHALARATHILDGADEALVSSIGRELLRASAASDAPEARHA